uniref:dynein regulatory complex protein 9 isoform X2 n=1 Tax=Jaculus jaculus TaxID=51337 RepID=UPI001E1AFCD6|nr:dynein regulatory complex protein 9 isoform X2 [Jaculus jaculus]
MEEDSLDASFGPVQGEHSVVMLVTGEPPSAEEEAVAPEVEVEAAPKVIEPLSLLDVLRVSVVLEDIIDQLSILRYIMPVQYERKQSLNTKSNLEKISALSSTRKISTALSSKEKSTLPEVKQGGQFSSELNKGKNFIFKRPTRQTIMTTETMKKIQSDRQFFSDVIANTMKELYNSGTFTNLLEALSQERENKMHFYDIIAREEKGRKQIKSLQKQLVDVKKERQAEVQNRNEYIAHLKDQLQEMKAKTNLENLYMKRNCELQISQTQKKCNKAEEFLLDEIEKLRTKTEEENRAHMDIEVFLRKEQQIREYEQVIIEDRIEKEKTRMKMEQDGLELKSIIKLQAWWRGTVVRREIGGFRLPRKEKDDSKDSKGKGKEKEKRRGKK